MAAVVDTSQPESRAVPLLRPGVQPAPGSARTSSWTVGAVASAILLAVIGVVLMVPFVFMISTSFNGAARTTVPFPPQIIPAQPTTEAYTIAIQQISLWRLYVNTLEVEVVEIVLSLSSAVLAGYALSKIRPRGSRLILFAALATMMIPTEAVILPNFLTFEHLRLLNSYWPIWLPAISYPFGTFLTKQYLDSLPSELRDAARVDGASEIRTLITVYLPLCKAVLATMGILLFLAVWNDYLWPLIVLTDPQTFTVQLGVSEFNQSIDRTSYALPATNMAATALSIIPVTVLFLILQRYVTESGATWGLKG